MSALCTKPCFEDYRGSPAALVERLSLRYVVRMRLSAWPTICLIIFASAPVVAQSGPVSLGVGAGISVPARVAGDTLQPSVAWGFHVNIPIIRTVHVSPSAELYRIGGSYATDVALAFNLVVPLYRSAVHLGVAPGVTASGTQASPHVGVLGGLAVPLVSNVGGFLRYRYAVRFRGDTTRPVSHLTAGLLFSF